MNTKECIICHKILPLEDFTISKGRSSYYRRNQCKICFLFKRREYSKTAQHKHTEKAWYNKNREHVNTWHRNYNKNNEKRKAKAKITGKNYRIKNKEHFYSIIRAWNQNNPDKYKAIQYRKESKKRGIEGNHTPLEIKELFLKQGGRCVYCRVNLIKTSYHRDHIIPIAKGGNNFINNIQLLCPKCNIEKRDKDPIVFMQIKGFLL
jgi:5-methylcytosine-specific restriction endonuclease McrA